MTGTTAALAILVKFTRQWLGSGEAPGGFEGAAQCRLPGGLQADVGSAPASPNTRAGVEDGGLGFDEHLLFNRREFDHGPAILRVAEGGEDLSRDAKVRMVHVRLLGRFREAKRETAKFVGRHASAPDGRRMVTIARRASNSISLTDRLVIQNFRSLVIELLSGFVDVLKVAGLQRGLGSSLLLHTTAILPINWSTKTPVQP